MYDQVDMDHRLAGIEMKKQPATSMAET